MIDNRTSYPAKLMSLALTFVVTGLLACSPASEGEPADAQAQGQAQTQAQPGTAAPAPGATVAPQGQPLPGQVAAPGSAPAAAAPPMPADKIPAVVARINGQEIRKDALLAEAERMQQQFAARLGQQTPATQEFYQKILDGMVAQQLLLAEAQAQGITVTEAEVNAQIEPLRKRMGDEKFKQALTTEKMTEDKFKQEVRKNAVVEKLLASKVVSTVKVTDQDIQAYYDQNKDEFKRPERARLRHILVRVEQNATAEAKQAARQKAEGLLARVKGGEDFAKVAQEASDDPGSKPRGGDLGWVAPGQTVEPFEKAAFALKPNEISPVVESRFGFHIIQLQEKQAADTAPLSEVKERLTTFLRTKQTGEAIEAHVNQLRSKAKIETFI
ncbi:MAG TPA: peptidylprolyl isomerase [Thermoanaerobaculia bacterium]|nr:peptidylprolyl isomerase [Thermoanaerobaculia bacterium]